MKNAKEKLKRSRARLKRARAQLAAVMAQLAAANAQLDAIDSLSEEVWESDEAASWVYKIRTGADLTGLPTQEEYEVSFLRKTRKNASS